MRFKWFWLSLAAIAVAFPAAAQSVVGSSIIDGRPVQLLSDFTWKYVSQPPSACQPIEQGVSFCGKSSGWVEFPPGSADIAANYRLNDRTYGLFIIEGIGSDDGMSTEFMRSAAIENAAKLNGGDTKNIQVSGLSSGEIDGLPSETFSYLVKLDQMPLMFTNTLVVDKHRTVQVVTYGLGSTLTDEMKAAHKQFLAETRMK